MTTLEGINMASTPENITEALQQRALAEIDAKVRQDMAGTPSTQQVDQEIAYRQAQEVEAIKALSEAEQTVVWKFKMSATEYAKGKR